MCIFTIPDFVPGIDNVHTVLPGLMLIIVYIHLKLIATFPTLIKMEKRIGFPRPSFIYFILYRQPFGFRNPKSKLIIVFVPNKQLKETRASKSVFIF